MARLTNNTLRTVRFYEEAGILQPIGRTEGGHRLFEPGQLDRLKFVTDMREAGMGLEEIRDLLETKQRAQSGGTAAVNAVMALKTHIRQLEDKLAVLARLHEDLSRTASCASACMGCEGEALFPNHCDDCSKIAAVTDMPRGMRVLWSLKTSGSLDGATVTAAAAAAGGNLPSGEPPSAE
jgi:DNA-binding transcriptional MerR regulator